MDVCLRELWAVKNVFQTPPLWLLYMSHFASQRGGGEGLSLLQLFQLHSPHLAAHSALKRSQRRLVPLLPNARCYHDLVSTEGGAGRCGEVGGWGSWYCKKAPSGAEIIRMLPRAQPQPLTGSDCAKPWTDRGIRISIHSRLTQSLIDLDLGAQRISLTGRPPPTPLIEPSSVCSENSHRYLNTYCFCLWHRLMIAHTSLLWLLPKASNTARILPE